MNKNKFYITTPIYYVNSKPHIGTLYSTLLADVTARWNKMKGREVFFLTGTDEHGQKIQDKAEELGKSPQEFVDSMIEPFKRIWKLYELDYDKFIRTTDDFHMAAVTSMLEKMKDQGDIYKAPYTGQYCVPCETFVNVGSESEKDEDGNYICPSCKRNLTEVSEECYYFRLSAYEEKLLKFYEEHPDFITPKLKINEVLSFVKGGLKDLCISRRTVSWGIPFPGDSDHTVYVWGDALTNYISAIGYSNPDKVEKAKFDFWWPADLHVMAKDIVKFHAVYWPAFLMSLNLPLPKKMMVHGYILSGKQKMSKSLGNVMDPELLAEWYGVEPVRYYLMRQMPVSQDGKFDLKDLESRISSDLANNLGNLVNRTITLALKNNLETVPPVESLEVASAYIKDLCEETFRSFCDEMNHYHYHIALSELWLFISKINAFFHEQQPWVLAKKNKELFDEVISVVSHSLYSIALMLWPILPKKMEELLGLLGKEFDLKKNYTEELRKNVWDKTFILKKSDKPLFVRPETHLKNDEETSNVDVKKKSATKKQDEIITIDDFSKVQMLAGTILECEPLKGSEKLYKMQVDLGKFGKRQILAGVAKFFKPEDLIGKQGSFVSNLKPRKLMGEESQGMMLFVKDNKGNMRMVTFSGEIENGTRLS